MKPRELPAVVGRLARRRWRVKKRPRVPAVHPIVVIAPSLTSAQVTWLRQLERLRRVRVVVFLLEPAAAIPGLTVLTAAALPTPSQAVDVVRTLTHVAATATVPVLTPAAGTGRLRLLRPPVAAAASPAVWVPSLQQAGAVAPAASLGLALAGEARSTAAAVHLVGAPGSVTGPRVSVVMTTYNDGAFAAQALASLSAQTYAELEIIVVDDGSTDDSVEVVRACAAADRRIRVLALPRNVGLFPARNLGMAAATGEFVTFQDADDVSRVDRIERCVAAMAGHDYVYGLFVRTLPDGTLTTLGAPTVYQEGIITLMVRRDLLTGPVGYFDPLRFTSDSEYIERLRALRQRGRYLPEVLYLARLRDNSLTTAQGPLALYTTSGQTTKSLAHATYVKAYRQAHRQRGELRWDADAVDRAYPAPPACLGGDQEAWFRAAFPHLDHAVHPLVQAHAADTLVRRRDLGGASLRRLLAERGGADLPRVGVVIASNRSQWIAASVANVARQRYPGLRLVIVDNSVESNEARWRSALTDQGVAARVLRVPPPGALGACLNAGLEELAADVDVMMKFDDDDFYAPDYVLEQALVHAQCGGLVGKFPLFYYSTQRGALYVRPGRRASLGRSPHVAGGTLTFATALWRRLGFDPTLSLGEDRDLILRARARGYPVTSSSLFNHCNIRHAAAQHTWAVAETELLGPDAAVEVGVLPWSDVPPLVTMVVARPGPGDGAGR
ncbi:MAG: glycosyltransferase [Kofleriaceae bacterium]|nr:glycosyltransferase [Kofleriaceae bacterium]